MIRIGSVAGFGIAGVLAVMFGVSLGNSAISQINPLYFQGAAVHPRDRGAALDPNAPTVIPNSYQQFYGFDEGREARAAACPGCAFAAAAMPAEALVHTASAPYFGSREERARDEAQERREIDSAYQQRLDDAAARRAAMDELRRYTHYRVSEDEVVREDPVPAESRGRPYYARHDVVLSDDYGDDQE